MPSAAQIISTGGLYGAERVLLELAAHLKARDWDSHVLAIDGAGADAVVEAARNLGLTAKRLSAEPVRADRQARLLAGYLDDHRIDVVHSHGYKGDILMAATRQPKRRACIASCHSWYSETSKQRLIERIDKFVLKRFSAVVAINPEIEADLLSLGVPRDRVQFIANGMDPPPPTEGARDRIRASLALASNQRLVLRVGRLAASKGNDVLMQALAGLPNRATWTLVLLGEGPEEPSLRALAGELGITSRVVFAGFRSDVADYLAAADLFVVPSFQEGLPMVLLEAMAAARPIVATRIAGNTIAIEDGHNGLLVVPRDAVALRAALARLMDHPPLGEELASAARSRFEKDFSRAAMGDRYIAVYKAALAARALAARAWAARA